jgi:hypothetical protein
MTGRSGPVGFVLDAEEWAQRHNGDLKNHDFEVADPHVRVFADTARDADLRPSSH